MNAAEYRKMMGLTPPGHDHQTGSRLQSAKPQCLPAPALVRETQGGGAGEGVIIGRTVVRVRSYRVRPLDCDNHAGGCKALCDQLRHCGLIEGDEPWKVSLETEQVKVKHYAEERVELTIIYP